MPMSIELDRETLAHENQRLQRRVNELERLLAAAAMDAAMGSVIPAKAPRPVPTPPVATRDYWSSPDSTALFRAYVETANDMVYTVDLAGRLTFMNPYGERILGCTQADWLGRLCLDFVADRYKLPTARAFENLMHTGELIDFEFALVNRDGHEIQMQVNGQLLHCDGQLIGGLGIARDITERKRFEQQLQMLSRALESCHDSAAIADLTGRLLYVNPATYRTFGYDDEALDGANAAVFYPDAGADQVTWLARQARDGGWSGEVICQRQGGDRFAALVSVGSICNEDGQAIAFSIVSRDITDQKQTQAELAAKNIDLERASRLKSEFLANMSHELRTPLTAILGFSSLLRQQLYGPLNDKQKVYVEQIRHSGDHLLSLINDVLDLSKVEAGQTKLEVAPVNVPELCEEAINLVCPQARSRAIAIACDLPKSLPTLMADPLRVRQMLVNLLSNAVKFSHDGGQVGVQGHTEAGYLLLSVWDRGIGIPEGDRHQLFQPFQQLDSSLARRHQGTGLGLALTRQLAELHGGTVTVESVLGQGSTFTIRLPLHLNPSRAEGRSGGAATRSLSLGPSVLPPEGGGARPQLLIVEDDPYNAQLLGDLLDSWGYDVAVMPDGDRALAWLEDNRAHLVFLDIHLPGMDGFEILKRLRRDDRWRSLPVVAATALAMASDRFDCLSAGMQDYLSKPLDYDHLAQVLLTYTGVPPRRGEED
ncbi:MAG: hypothetical protein Fur0042_06790 [Cyanophyceae cyanobacterium]